MKKNSYRTTRQIFFYLLIAGILSISLGACTGTLTVSCQNPNHVLKTSFTCTTGVSLCKKIPETLKSQDIIVELPPWYVGNMYNDLWGSSGDLDHRILYADLGKLAVFEGGELDENLKGSIVIKTRSTDWSNNNKEFLKIHLNKIIDGFFLAYDSREAAPDWLDAEYTQVGSVLTSVSEATPSGTTTYITLNIWKKDEVGTSVEVPGNSYEKEWKTVKNPLMYVIIIKPNTFLDCSNNISRVVTYKDTFDSDPGGLAMAEAQNLALQACQKEAGAQEYCQPPACQEGLSVCDEMSRGFRLSYPLSSVIEFPISPAMVYLEVDEQIMSYNTSFSGSLDFEYEPFSANSLHINNMELKGTSFDTTLGKVDEIEIFLPSPVNAICQDMPPTHPCTHYRIPIDSMKTVISATLGGQPVGWSAVNPLAIDIRISQQNHLFQYSGMFTSTIMANSNNLPMNVKFDLTGNILNFLPVAVAKFEGRILPIVGKITIKIS